MGFDIKRFKGTIVDEIVCILCEKVVQEPVQCRDEHIFCSICLKNHLNDNKMCPVDGKVALVGKNPAQPISRVLKAIVDSLEISCDFKEYGCSKFIKLSDLESHVAFCQHHPNKPRHVAIQTDLPVDKRLEETVKTLKRKLDDEQTNVSELESKLKKFRTDTMPEHEKLKLRNKELESINIKLEDRIEHLRKSLEAKNTPVSVNRTLRSKKKINYFVYRLMEDVKLPQFNNFSTTEEHHKEAERVGRLLNRIVLNQLNYSGKNILLLMEDSYVAICLALHVGPSGRVVTVNKHENYKLFGKDYEYLLKDGRLLLENQDIDSFQQNGSHQFGPYDVILTLQSTVSDFIVSQLRPRSGIVINILSGKRLEDIFRTPSLRISTSRSFDSASGMVNFRLDRVNRF